MTVLAVLSSAGVKTHLGPSDVWRCLRVALPVCTGFPPGGQTQPLAMRPLKAHYGSITCSGQGPPHTHRGADSLYGLLGLGHRFFIMKPDR